MNKEFDFDNVGKRMPYCVPDGFFEETQRKIMQRAHVERRMKVRRWRRWAIETVAVAAILLGVWFVPSFLSSPLPSSLSGDSSSSSDEHTLATDAVTSSTDLTDRWIRSLSDEELEELVAFSENDIFLN